MSAVELEKNQAEKLTKILSYTIGNVPYYKNSGLPKTASLADFPILTKSILRKQGDSLISDEFKKEKLEKNHSSGSSGVQSFTYMDYEHKFFLRALQTHWWTWGGYLPGKILLQAGMSLKRGFTKKVKDIFFRVTYMDAFNLSEKGIKKNLERVKNKSPKHLAGYPSALNEIALVAIKEDKAYAFKSLISYGDKLFDKYRDNFNKAFENPSIINTYGCAEGLLMACTADLPYYYIMSPHVFIEIVNDEGEPVKDGERGHILVTCLTNFAMPLIRYKLGDLGIMLPKDNYPKKRKFNYPLLQELTGRETDVIKAPNGNVLIVHSFTGIIEFYDEIKQFKVIQVTKNKMVIEYITDTSEELSLNTRKEIGGEILSLVDNSMEISFKLVTEIAPSPSGKPQIVEIKTDLK
jgi:phenylacetate-CoA ligase